MTAVDELNVLRFAANTYKTDMESKFGESELITVIAEDIMQRCDRIESAIVSAMGHLGGFSQDQIACEKYQLSHHKSQSANLTS